MIVKNLTAHSVRIDLKNITEDHEEYSIHIVPHGSTDISNLTAITNRLALGSSIYLEGEVLEKVADEDPESNSVEETNQVEEEKTAPEQLESKFICEKCGAEFASSRSLAAHMTRSHKS